MRGLLLFGNACLLLLAATILASIAWSMLFTPSDGELSGPPPAGLMVLLTAIALLAIGNLVYLRRVRPRS